MAPETLSLGAHGSAPKSASVAAPSSQPPKTQSLGGRASASPESERSVAASSSEAPKTLSLGAHVNTPKRVSSVATSSSQPPEMLPSRDRYGIQTGMRVVLNYLSKKSPQTLPSSGNDDTAYGSSDAPVPPRTPLQKHSKPEGKTSSMRKLLSFLERKSAIETEPGRGKFRKIEKTRRLDFSQDTHTNQKPGSQSIIRTRAQTKKEDLASQQ